MDYREEMKRLRDTLNAHGRIIFKLKIDLIQSSVHTCFNNVQNIIFHTRKHNLSLRISEAGVVLQHFRSFFCKHQTEENNAFKRAALCSHSIYRSLVNIFFTKFFYFFCIERTW